MNLKSTIIQLYHQVVLREPQQILQLVDKNKQEVIKSNAIESTQVFSFSTATQEDDKTRQTLQNYFPQKHIQETQLQQNNFVQGFDEEFSNPYQLQGKINQDQILNNGSVKITLAQKQLLFNQQIPSKSHLQGNTYFSVDEQSEVVQLNNNNNYVTQDSKQQLESEVVHLEVENEYSTTQEAEDEFQITQTSKIDWEDQKKLEQFVKKQSIIEEVKGFDPAYYFGGLKINNLEEVEYDSRLSDMFKNEMQLYLQASNSTKHEPKKSGSLFSPSQLQKIKSENGQQKKNLDIIEKAMKGKTPKLQVPLPKSQIQMAQTMKVFSKPKQSSQPKAQVFDYKKSVQTVKGSTSSNQPYHNDKIHQKKRTLSQTKIKPSKSVRKIKSDNQVNEPEKPLSLEIHTHPIQSPKTGHLLLSPQQQQTSSHISPIRTLTAFLTNSINQQAVGRPHQQYSQTVIAKTSPSIKVNLSNIKTSSPEIQVPATAVSKYKKGSQQLLKQDLPIKKFVQGFSTTHEKVKSFHSNGSIADQKPIMLKENKQVIQLQQNKSSQRNHSSKKSNDKSSMQILANKSLGSNILMQLLNSPQSPLNSSNTKTKSPFGVNQMQNTLKDLKQQSQSLQKQKPIIQYEQEKSLQQTNNTLNQALYKALIINKTSLLKKTISDLSLEHEENICLKQKVEKLKANLNQVNTERSLGKNGSLNDQQNLKIQSQKSSTLVFSPQSSKKTKTKMTLLKQKNQTVQSKLTSPSACSQSYSKFKVKAKCFSTLAVQKIL